MNKEDFPIMVYQGRWLITVPELPGVDYASWSRCYMCLACPDGKRDEDSCKKVQSKAGGCTLGGKAAIHVPEDRFQEYVVELVRRRVSS